mmetsp:Transcript_6525/g.18202  ORF Transcript_6525/g.18202 Transcript_6525/m.18202 type:complete len:188 (+) Transcript_6525:354-917(+)
MERGVDLHSNWLRDFIRYALPFPCCLNGEDNAEIPMFNLRTVSDMRSAASRSPADSSFTVTIRTSKPVVKSGNNSPVWLVFIGESGRSEPIHLMHDNAESGTAPLTSSPECAAMDASSEAVFRLRSPGLGQLKYLIVGLEDENEDPLHIPAWHLDYIKVVNQQGEVGRWYHAGDHTPQTQALSSCKA